jgi:hypothetical protein
VGGAPVTVSLGGGSAVSVDATIGAIGSMAVASGSGTTSGWQAETNSAAITIQKSLSRFIVQAPEHSFI